MLSVGWMFYRAPVSVVSVNVNPSVELGVNRFDRVVNAEAYNADGAAVPDGVELDNLRYTEALEVLLSSAAMQPYLANSAFVSVAVAGSGAKSQEMLRCLSTSHFAQAGEVECSRADPETLDAARIAGLSVGRDKAFVEL